MTVDERARAALSDIQGRAAAALDVDAALASVVTSNPRRSRFAVPAVAVAVTILVLFFAWAHHDASPENAPPADPIPTAPVPNDPEAATGHAFIVSISTGARTRLPRHITDIPLARNFVASPDGTQVAFSDFNHVYVTTLLPGLVQRVGKADQYTVPAWSRDGDRLVYSVGGTCILLDVETGQRRTIVRGALPLLAPNFNEDGSAVLYTRRAGKAFGLWVTDLSSGRTALLAHRSAWGFYSPDGSQIAFRGTSADEPIDLEFTDRTLSVMTSTGRFIFPTAGGGTGTQGDALAFWPSWSPNGALIATQDWHGSDLSILKASSGALVDGISTEGLGPDTHSSWMDDDHLIVERITGCTTTVEC